jgi:ankyrin repeat protein
LSAVLCCAGSSATANIWDAAESGDLAEVQRLVGQDPGLLNARDEVATPLLYASQRGRIGVVLWLVDQGAAINERDAFGCTPLFNACLYAGLPVVRVLVERGADPTIVPKSGSTLLIAASCQGHVEVVRVLLGHPGAKATIKWRNTSGRTALWLACHCGRGGVARALLENGADPTIADSEGITPTAIAKQQAPFREYVEGRRECVAALKVRPLLPLLPSQHLLLS